MLGAFKTLEMRGNIPLNAYIWVGRKGSKSKSIHISEENIKLYLVSCGMLANVAHPGCVII